jgi:hypothetical protein
VLAVVKPPVHAPDPRAEATAETIRKRGRSRKQSGEHGTLTAVVELQVLDAAARTLLRIGEHQVEEILHRVEDPGIAQVDPPFVMIISGIVAIEATTRTAKNTVARAFERNELTLVPT